MLFKNVYVSTVRGWALVSFLIAVALIAWQGYSAWRDRSKAARDDKEETPAETSAQGGDYTTMA